MKKTRAYHPLLFAIFPTLFLYSHNQSEYAFNVIFIPLAVTTGLAIALWGLLGLVLRNITRAGLVTSVFLLLFFSYGQVHELAWYFFSVEPFSFGTASVLQPLFLFLFVVASFLLIRTRRDLSRLTRFANYMSVFLLVVPAFTIGLFQIKGGALPASPGETNRLENRSADTPAESDLPDIYYIILDAFAREDILADIYDYPHSALYTYLKEAGFYVARRSGTNYCQTMLSLSSTLNYKYLDATTDGFNPDSKDRVPLMRMVFNNRAMEFLRERGYTIVATATGSAPTEFRHADVFLEPSGKAWFLDEFQSGLLNTTPLPQLIPKMDHIPFMGESFSHPQADARRKLVLRTFDLLPKIPARQSPKFVFTHIVMPHPPFLFDSNGEPRNPRGVFHLADGNALIGRYIPTRERYIELYRDQLMFIEKKTIPALRAILANSARPPVIIVQADHGPGAYLDWNNSNNTYMPERLGILNAYFLPGGGDSLLYETITPVNTFPLIFNHYLGAKFKLQRDESYFSLWEKPYWFMPAGRMVQAESPPGPKR